MLTLMTGMLLLAGSAAATPPAPPPDPCAAPERRQFDFWVGDWEVLTRNGQVAGRNRIEKVHGECAIQENWTGAKGLRGTSFNIWSANDRRWHQAWVDSQGNYLLLEGGLRDGRMVMEGTMPRPGGGTTMHRVTWEPLSDGGVRQHWQSSVDGGAVWTDVFYGIYRRAATPAGGQ